MFKLPSAGAVTRIFAFIVISTYCIQISSSEGGGSHVCMGVYECVCKKYTVGGSVVVGGVGIV